MAPHQPCDDVQSAKAQLRAVKYVLYVLCALFTATLSAAGLAIVSANQAKDALADERSAAAAVSEQLAEIRTDIKWIRKWMDDDGRRE